MNGTIIKIVTNRWVVVMLVVIIGSLIRLYRIETLAVFLSDQAIDSEAVRQMLSGNFTLLGPRASVGQFFNGPIVYYLMIPFYYVMRLDPLAGTYFQIALQIIAMPLIYLLAKRFGGHAAGLMALIMFALSPLIIWYSRATFNSYPALPFGICILLILTSKHAHPVLLGMLGMLMGMIVQMHYFLYAFVAGFFTYLLILSPRKVKTLLCTLAGFVMGLSPFLLFELRHNFFNTHAILSMEKLVTNIVLWDRLSSVGVGLGSLIGFSNAFIGLALLLGVSTFIFLLVQDNALRLLYGIELVILLGLALGYGGYMQTHYLIGFMPIYIVGLAIVLNRILPKKTGPILVCLLCAVILLMRSDIFAVSTVQDGLSLIDQRYIVKTIAQWKTTTDAWNITQDAQQDNRAMPLRYLISLTPTIPAPLSYEDYHSNKELFVVALRDKALKDIATWEVQTFGDEYTITQQAVINSKYSLYFLRKQD